MSHMKIAHLILAHKNPGQLQRMLRALEHPAFHFYIHVDRKSDESAFRFLGQMPRVHFVRQRVSVQWGGYSLVQAQLNGMREILDDGDFDYVNILSAQDFPLKPADAILRFFEENRGTEFISATTYDDDPEWWDVALCRIRDYHFQNWKIPGKYRLQHLANRILPRRKYPNQDTVVGRSQWFSVTRECARYMLRYLDEHPEVVRFFHYTWGADEFIFSTVVFNSPFRERSRDNLMYTDWSERKPNPKLLGTEDFSALVHSGKLFARKFDLDKDSNIFNLLEEWLKGRNPVH